MSETRLTRAEKKAETRERLLAAAIDIAERDGFAALTVNRVAEAAGLTKGAVYSNFESKEELLLEVVDRLTPGLKLTSDVVPRRAFPELLDLIADALIRMSRSRSKELLFAFEFDALALRDSKVRAAVRRQYRGSDALDGDPVAAMLHEALEDSPLSEGDYVEAAQCRRHGSPPSPPRARPVDGVGRRHPVDAFPARPVKRSSVRRA